jgi:hypothetical protein
VSVAKGVRTILRFFSVHGWNAADGHRLPVGQRVSVGARKVRGGGCGSRCWCRCRAGVGCCGW